MMGEWKSRPDFNQIEKRFHAKNIASINVQNRNAGRMYYSELEDIL